MDFLKTELAQFLWLIVTTIVFIVLMKLLVENAAASLKKTHSWKSVIDEIVVGLIVVIGFVIVARTPLSVIVDFVVPKIVFLWDKFIGFLRQVGLPF